MSFSPIKSFNKYLLSYNDSSKNSQQVGIYALDAYECLSLAKDFNSYIQENPNSVTRIQQKF